MSLYLHTLQPTPGSKKKKKRVGRGGKRGTYSGRGLKGQKSRSGGRSGLKRRGMRQLIERTHKLRGFKSIHKKPNLISLTLLNKEFKDNDKVTPHILLKKKLVNDIKNGVKVLSNGRIKVKLTLSGLTLSKTAQTAVEQAGGKVILKAKKVVAKKKDKKTKK